MEEGRKRVLANRSGDSVGSSLEKPRTIWVQGAERIMRKIDGVFPK